MMTTAAPIAAHTNSGQRHRHDIAGRRGKLAMNSIEKIASTIVPSRARQKDGIVDERFAGDRDHPAPQRHARVGRGEQAEHHVVAAMRCRTDHEPCIRGADRGDHQRDEAADHVSSFVGARSPYSSILRSSVGRLMSSTAQARRLFQSVLASTRTMWRRSSSRSVDSSSSPAGGRGRCGLTERQQRLVEHVGLREHDRAGQRVLELADISRPCVRRAAERARSA